MKYLQICLLLLFSAGLAVGDHGGVHHPTQEREGEMSHIRSYQKTHSTLHGGGGTDDTHEAIQKKRLRGGETKNATSTHGRRPEPRVGCPDGGSGTAACPWWTEIVIVGAGISGLTAASTLRKEGFHDIKVLEASSRGYGGRIQKKAPFGFDLDVGAEWIHIYRKTTGNGKFKNPNQLLRAIVDRNNLDVSSKTKLEPRKMKVWDGSENEDDTTGTDYRWFDYTWYDFVKDEIVEPQNVQQKIVNGCVVDHIWYDSKYTIAYCKNGQAYESYYSIVTVPMEILKQNKIQFEPALPSSFRNAIRRYKMGEGIKVWMEFKSKFYPEYQALESIQENHDVYDDCDENSWGQLLYYDEMYGHSNNKNKHVMGMFAHGTGTAARFKDMDDDAVVKDLLSQLDSIYNGKASEEYTGRSFVQQWTNERYIQTGYTQYAPRSAMRQMRKPLVSSGTVWFAGEAIPPDADDWGFAHGAAQSGKRAAEEVEAKYCARMPEEC